MRIKQSLAKGLLIGLAISLIPVAAISAPKVIPGTTCKVNKQTVTYLNGDELAEASCMFFIIQLKDYIQ